MLWRSANCNGLRWCRLWKISLSFYFSSMINQRWLRKILSKNLNKIANRRRHNKLCLESYFSYLKRLPSKQKSSFSFSSFLPSSHGMVEWWPGGGQSRTLSSSLTRPRSTPRSLTAPARILVQQQLQSELSKKWPELQLTTSHILCLAFICSQNSW